MDARTKALTEKPGLKRFLPHPNDCCATGLGRALEGIRANEQSGPGDLAVGMEPHSMEATGCQLPLLGMPNPGYLPLSCTALHSHGEHTMMPGIK